MPQGYQELKQSNRALVTQQEGATIEHAHIPRSTFTTSWTRKTAFDAGWLVPILVDEVLPGDHMTYDVVAYIRMATPLFPLFDDQRVDTFFFFVPNRLVWDNWTKFMGEQDNPGDSIAYTVPVVTGTVGGEAVGSITDHFGLPVIGQIDPAGRSDPNALPFRAYNLIFNTWFRDENLKTAMPVLKDNGPDAMSNYLLEQRAKAHDYFTSALPWPQKFTAPTIPVAGMAPIRGIGTWAASNVNGPLGAAETGGVITNYQNHIPGYHNTPGSGAGYVAIRQEAGYPAIYADLAAAASVSINTLRQAWMVQSLLERDARGGTRYTELIRSHFGVVNPDFRLQRPEYIGGGQTPLNITPIAQTAPTTGLTVGALGAAATAAGRHHASYAATEHGFIIGLINVRTQLSYQQGIHRMWMRRTRYDYYFPSLAGLGEQAVLQMELYQVGSAVPDNVVFGYQERWQEYRTRYSEVTGIMRSTAPGTLDAWHLAQKFTSAPVLNTSFIVDQPPMARVLAGASATTNQQYLADISYTRRAVRPLPTYGTPVTLGRF